MSNIFETATRNKLRFATPVGQISTEDVWTLPLTSTSKPSLNSIAKGLAKKLRESDEDNFVGEKSTDTTILELKLDIVKHIIEVRLNDKKLKENAKETKERNDLILSIISKKQNEALESKSIEELTKMIG